MGGERRGAVGDADRGEDEEREGGKREADGMDEFKPIGPVPRQE